jgi:hypothetical protein
MGLISNCPYFPWGLSPLRSSQSDNLEQKQAPSITRGLNNGLGGDADTHMLRVISREIILMN